MLKYSIYTYILYIYLLFYFWRPIIGITRNTTCAFWLWDLCSLFWPHFSLNATEHQEREKKKRSIEVHEFSGSLALKKLKHRQARLTAWYFSHTHLKGVGLYLISNWLPRAAMILCWAFKWGMWTWSLQSWTKPDSVSPFAVLAMFSITNVVYRKNIKVS